MRHHGLCLPWLLHQHPSFFILQYFLWRSMEKPEPGNILGLRYHNGPELYICAYYRKVVQRKQKSCDHLLHNRSLHRSFLHYCRSIHEDISSVYRIIHSSSHVYPTEDAGLSGRMPGRYAFVDAGWNHLRYPLCNINHSIQRIIEEQNKE